MALTRKQKRKINRLRRDADRLWGEQQAVLEHAREIAGRAGDSARDYAEAELLPPLRKAYERNVVPAFEGGVESGRRALVSAEKSLSKNVIPAIVAAGGTVAGAVRELADQNRDTIKLVQDRAGDLSKDASKRFAELQHKLDRTPVKPKRTGPGVGGWFLIGAAVAAVAAVGYALWQTFRADDDLWIADEELDAPVESVTTPAA